MPVLVDKIWQYGKKGLIDISPFYAPQKTKKLLPTPLMPHFFKQKPFGDRTPYRQYIPSYTQMEKFRFVFLQ